MTKGTFFNDYPACDWPLGTVLIFGDCCYVKVSEGHLFISSEGRRQELREDDCLHGSHMYNTKGWFTSYVPEEMFE